MKAYNRILFALLEGYCASRGDPIESAGDARFLSSNSEEKRLLKGLRPGKTLRFGRHRSLIHLYLDGEHYVALVGFEFEPNLVGLDVIESNVAFTMCALLDSGISPNASPANVRNIVEIGKMGDADYRGHDRDAVETLFPDIRVVESSEALTDDSVWLVFLMICAEECMQGGSWIEDGLAENLVALTELNVPAMPYAAICRSLFDADPRSLFMALYRCIEATYSHQASKQLVNRLGLKISWHSLAEALEDEIGWHPQEAASLNEVLKGTRDDDLAEICKCLRVTVGKDVQVSAGRAVYSLRNSIVHFRPGTKDVKVDEIDWNRLCVLLTNVVFDVFTQAYS